MNPNRFSSRRHVARCTRVGFLGLTAMIVLLHASDAAILFSPVQEASPVDYTWDPFALEELHLTYSLQINSSRYQQVYRSAEFANFHDGPILIGSVGFLGENLYPRGFGAFLPSLEVMMGTTTKEPDGLSATFAENVTSNMSVVLPKGPYLLAGHGTGGTTIYLRYPFFYDPRLGNLLVEIRRYHLIPPPYFSEFDYPGVLDLWMVERDAVSRVYARDVNAETGIADTGGLTSIFAVTTIAELSVSVRSTNMVMRWIWNSVPYVLQESSALGQGNSWMPASALMTTNGAFREATVPLDAPAGARFFRLYLPPPPQSAGGVQSNSESTALTNRLR